ncbi:MAG TPA: hypothetical protein VIU41_04350 [Geobacteraceae bacterium]
MMRLVKMMLCALLATTAVALAEDEHRPIGLVKTATGDAAIVRDGRRIAAQSGYPLLRDDILSTGDTGTMGIILRDDTVLSLGPSTEIRIEKFAFEPAKQNLGVVVRVAHGIIGYLSGKISRLAPGAVRLETPVATLGVRGTYLAARIVP